jgi:hypothetical protein
MSNSELNEQVNTNVESQTTRPSIEYEKIEEMLINMSKDPNLLKQGYSLISSYEKCRNFYLNFLKVIFISNLDSKVKKLAASTLRIFLNKNWSDDEYITNEERMVNIAYLLN